MAHGGSGPSEIEAPSRSNGPPSPRVCARYGRLLGATRLYFRSGACGGQLRGGYPPPDSPLRRHARRRIRLRRIVTKNEELDALLPKLSSFAAQVRTGPGGWGGRRAQPPLPPVPPGRWDKRLTYGWRRRDLRAARGGAHLGTMGWCNLVTLRVTGWCNLVTLRVTGWCNLVTLRSRDGVT